MKVKKEKSNVLKPATFTLNIKQEPGTAAKQGSVSSFAGSGGPSVNVKQEPVSPGASKISNNSSKITKNKKKKSYLNTLNKDGLSIQKKTKNKKNKNGKALNKAIVTKGNIKTKTGAPRFLTDIKKRNKNPKYKSKIKQKQRQDQSFPSVTVANIKKELAITRTIINILQENNVPKETESTDSLGSNEERLLFDDEDVQGSLVIDTKVEESDEDMEKSTTEDMEKSTTEDIKKENVVEEGSKIVQSDAKDDNKKTIKKYVLFLGNLPFKVTKEQVEEHFKMLSRSIVSIRLLTNPHNGFGRGCGFLELKDSFSYKKALKLHRSKLEERTIRVEYTVPGKNTNTKRKSFIKSKTKKILGQKKKKKKSKPMKKKY